MVLDRVDLLRDRQAADERLEVRQQRAQRAADALDALELHAHFLPELVKLGLSLSPPLFRRGLENRCERRKIAFELRASGGEHLLELALLDRPRLALIAFSSDPQVAAPPTTDRDLLRASVDELGFFQGFGGTAIDDALAAAVELGKQAVPGQGGRETIAYAAAKPSSLVSILFLSDGKQTRGTLLPLEGAQRAKAAGIPVYTVALGTPHGVLTRDAFGGGGFFGGGGGFPRRIPVPPDPTTLRAIANATGGKFFNARSAEALQSAYKELGSKLGRVPGRKEVDERARALRGARPRRGGRRGRARMRPREAGWEINVVLARTPAGWRLLEAGCVYP